MTNTKREMLESLIEGNKSHINTLELQIVDFERALSGETNEDEVWCDPEAVADAINRGIEDRFGK